MRITSPLLLAALLGGCTAVKASIQLVSAEQALVRAETYGASESAEYEYIMALRYLEKAREEAGYSEFRMADALARQSAEWSDRAIIFVERRGRTNINLDDFQNMPEAVPPPAPASLGPEPESEHVPPPPIPGDAPPAGPAGEETDILQELFGEEATPTPTPDAPASEDFEMNDDIEIPR